MTQPSSILSTTTILTSLVIFQLTTPVYNDFLATRLHITRHKPSTTSSLSLFGYSIATLRHATQYYLLVSDPVAPNAHTKTDSGNVYICPISKLNFSSSSTFCSSTIPFNYSTKHRTQPVTNYMKIGYSMSSIQNSNEFTICAPGYSFINNFNKTVFPGLCGLWSAPNSSPFWADQLFPYNPSNDKVYDFDGFGKCFGGFSSKLLKQSSSNSFKFVASSPFCRATSGITILHRESLNTWKPYRSVKVDDLDEMQSYIGYAMDAGSSSIYYSSPVLSAKDSQIFMSFGLADNITTTHRTNQLAEYTERKINYLGYSLSVLSLASKEFVLLGAPYQSDLATDMIDFGCVYILPTRVNTVLESTYRSYCSQERKGLFGQSVLNIGDINYDDMDDFAVGCPGCHNGTGAVYFFLGSLRLDLEPFQIIKAASLSPDLRGFGWTMSKGVDLDENGADDLVVSSVFSNHVTVLPTKLLLVGKADVYSQSVLVDRVKGTSITLDNFMFDIITTKKPHSIKLKFELKRGFNVRDYDFDVIVDIQEYFTQRENQRFLINVTKPSPYPLADYSGKYLLKKKTSMNENIVEFEDLEFYLLMNGASSKKMSLEEILRPVDLKLFVNIVKKSDGRSTVASPELFPSVLINNQLMSNLSGSIRLPLYQFSPAVCSEFCMLSEGFEITSLNGSSIIINDRTVSTLKVQIRKLKGSYYGGIILKVVNSMGLFILDNVVITYSNGTQRRLKYHYDWHSGHGDIILAEPFSTYPDIFTEPNEAVFTLTISVNFDVLSSFYYVIFRLQSLFVDSQDLLKLIVPKDAITDVSTRVNIKINSSLIVDIRPVIQDTTVIDTAMNASYSHLHQLVGKPVTGRFIGPPLNHTYELSISTNPKQSVKGITLVVSIPFLSDNKDLLVLFPSEFVQKLTADGNEIKRFSGFPFTTDKLNSLDGTSCTLDSSRPEYFKYYISKGVVMLDVFNKSGKALPVVLPPHAQSRLNRVKRNVVVQYSSKNSSSTKIVNSKTTVRASSNSDEDVGSSSVTLPIFDCENPNLAPFQFECVTFRCPIPESNTIAANGQKASLIYSHINARLWSATFFRKHLKHFAIKTSIRVDYPSLNQFNTVTKVNGTSFMQHFYFALMKIPYVERIPWHYIILGIIIGIILLLLLILLLWWLNFFKRKRIQYDKVATRDTNTFENDQYYS